MSEQAPETSGGSGVGNVLKRKVGPLPMWGWMGIALALAFVFYLYKKHSSASSSAAASSNQSAEASGQAAGGVESSLVPQFVNQTYVQDTPPPAPNVTVNNQVPTPPTGGTQPSTGGTTTAAPPKVSQYQAPTGLTATKASSTSLKVAWSNLTGATPPSSYTVAIYSKAGKLLSQQTVNAPDATGGKSTATITGLPANQSGLQVHVWANGGTTAPPHASTSVNL